MLNSGSGSPYANLLARLALGFVAIVVALGSFGHLRTAYGEYKDSQNRLYSHAQEEWKLRMAAYESNVSVVTAAVVNPTGGTVHVYIGNAGQLQNLGNGVESAAPPIEVASIQPQQSATLDVHDWFGKYIQIVTTYIFLGSVASKPTMLKDLSYSGAGLAGVPATVTLYGQPNQSDSNFHAAELDQSASIPGQDIFNAQLKLIGQYAQTTSPKRVKYPTDIWSFLLNMLGLQSKAPLL